MPSLSLTAVTFFEKMHLVTLGVVWLTCHDPISAAETQGHQELPSLHHYPGLRAPKILPCGPRIGNLFSTSSTFKRQQHLLSAATQQYACEKETSLESTGMPTLAGLKILWLINEWAVGRRCCTLCKLASVFQ